MPETLHQAWLLGVSFHPQADSYFYLSHFLVLTAHLAHDTSFPFDLRYLRN